MPRITGEVGVILTVLDPLRSAAWYAEVLGFEEASRYIKPDGSVGEVCLRHAETGLTICVVDHAANPGDGFDEHRTGLDPLELMVPERSDLDEWAARLDRLGVRHSGVKQPAYMRNALITLRDPDNIQLELFWRAG